MCPATMIEKDEFSEIFSTYLENVFLQRATFSQELISNEGLLERSLGRGTGRNGLPLHSVAIMCFNSTAEAWSSPFPLALTVSFEGSACSFSPTTRMYGTHSFSAS